MSSIRSIIRHAASAALLAATAVAGPAQAVSIDVGSYTKSGLGAEFATSYDTFTITGAKVSMAMPQAPLAISLGTFWFEVGPNCYSCTLTPSFDAILDVKVHGDTQQLHIPVCVALRRAERLPHLLAAGAADVRLRQPGHAGHRPGRDRDPREPGRQGVRRPVRDRLAGACVDHAGSRAGQLRADACRLRRRRVRCASPPSLTRKDVARAGRESGSGAGEKSRTPDLRITNALLYQLSYAGVAAAAEAAARGAHSSGAASLQRERARGAARPATFFSVA